MYEQIAEELDKPEYQALVGAGDVDGLVAVASAIETATGIFPIDRGFLINALRLKYAKPKWEPGESIG